MNDKPHPMVFDVLSMDGDFDEVCDILFGSDPNQQGSSAEEEVKELEKDVQNLDDLIDRANPGAKEKMATIRRNAAIDLILASHDEALRLNLALASAIGASSSENQGEAINQLKRATIRELIGQILDLKVAYCSLVEKMKEACMEQANIEEGAKRLFEANIKFAQELNDHAVNEKISTRLKTFQSELYAKGLESQISTQDLLKAIYRIELPDHDGSNGEFLVPNEDCHAECCYFYRGDKSPEESQEPLADATEGTAKVEEVVSEAVATEPAEIAGPSPAPKPARARKTRIVTLTEKSTTRKAREKKAVAKKSPKKGSKPSITEKPKGKKRPPEGGLAPEDEWGPTGW